jgi:hypothetical protein
MWDKCIRVAGFLCNFMCLVIGRVSLMVWNGWIQVSMA